MNAVRLLVPLFATLACGERISTFESAPVADLQAPQEIDYHTRVRGPDMINYEGPDLRNPGTDDADLVGVTGMVLLFDDEREHKAFDRQAETAQFRIVAHCQQDRDPNLEGVSFNCGASDDSFNQHRGDHFVAGTLAEGTAAFIGPNLIVTASHVISVLAEEQDRTYLLMNEAHRVDDGFAWRRVDTDEDGHLDRLEVDMRYVLAVEPVARFESTGKSDWVIARVKPVGAEPIPKHPSLCISSDAPEPKADILVPSHPRYLPLKIADGRLSRPGVKEGDPLTAWFDISAGSSGAPVVLAARRRELVGVVMGHTKTDQREIPAEITCRIDQIGQNDCPAQLITPVAHFATIASQLQGVETCPSINTK